MPNTKNTNQPAKPPVVKLRIGLLTAAVWERPTEKGSFYSTTFERRYRDSEGNWQSGHAFDTADLLALAKLAYQAHSRILDLRNGDIE